MNYLSEHGVQSLIHYPIPPHLQEAYSDLGYKVGDFPISERLAERVLTLPLYNGMTEEEMDAILEETEIEGYTLATEIKEKNPRLLAYIEAKLPGKEHEFVAHTELKKMSAGCKFAIRTGEFTPYPNVILRAGVAF